MRKSKFKHVNRVPKLQKDGSTRYHFYFRPTGQKLEGEEGSLEFSMSYARAVEAWKSGEAKLARVDGTLKAHIEGYKRSTRWTKLGENTRTSMAHHLREIEELFGHLTNEQLNAPAIKRTFFGWRDSLVKEGKTRAADHRLDTLSQVLTYAVKYGELAHNHVKGFDKVYKSDRSDAIWTEADIERFCQVASLEMRHALFLALYTGQRRGHLLRLKWSDYRDGYIWSKPEQNRKRAGIIAVSDNGPLKRLLEEIKATAAQRPTASLTILTQANGTPWTDESAFSKAFRKDADRAGIPRRIPPGKDPAHPEGIPGLDFHDLRGTAVTMLAEAGCTHHQISAISGHSMQRVMQILEKYSAKTRLLAERAAELQANYLGTKTANRLQTVASMHKQEGAK